MKKHTRVNKVRSRVAAVAVATAASVGLVVGTAVPAEATIWHYVSSSWVEAYAGSTSNTARDGMLQAYALLGNDYKWGARSSSSTLAVVNGFNLTHKAQLFRDGKLIVSS
ncbi:hypothetical protein ACPPVW_03080 [Leifsonia sp. McL0607]|uniref:hypothetical protein n=1 Tax=Leifsonia sp. McL0607 TaxID=3415672 RepID=UPI003CEB066C